MTKIDLAETVEQRDIRQLSDNCYKIKSLSDSKKKLEYDVLLDNGHGMPSCGCHAWTWTLLPCKHIFAVIDGRFQGATWNCIPPSYTNSPFFTLDFDVVTIPVSGSIANEDDLCDEEDVEGDVINEKVSLSDNDLPKCKKVPRSKLKYFAIKCRESLSIIQNATYLCQEESTLEHLCTLLNEATSYIHSKLNKEEGLIPEMVSKKRKENSQPKPAKKAKLVSDSGKHLKLRKRKDPKSITRRYGKSTSKNTKENGKDKENEKEEEIIIEGHSSVPQSILESVADMVSQMPKPEWKALLSQAKKEAATSTDRKSQIAVTLLEENCEADHIQTLKTISDSHCPGDMTNPEKFRMSILILHKLVEKNKFLLKRNFEEENRERQSAERACVEALEQWEDSIIPQPTSQASEITSNSKRSVKKTVQWETGESAQRYTNWTDIDSQKARNNLMKIWDQKRTSNYIKARVYGYNVTDADLKSLKSPSWLTDQVLDAYLAFLAQREWDKGKKVKHIDTSKMTSIINDHVQSSKRKCRVMEYDTIIGVYHQRGHWDLVVIEPKTFTVYFYNPLGETAFQCRQVLNGWRNYMGRNMFLSVQWKLEVKEHSKQKDGSSCGVYCLMFAERHLGGESLLNISKEDVERKRAEVGSTLMLFDEHMVDCCPCCGLTMSDCKGDMVTCGVCLRKFHRKNYCVGELIVNMSVQNFTCKECSLKSNVQY